MDVLQFRGDHRFLSNFYPVEVRGAGGHWYRSVEHAYQAAKTEDKLCWIQLRDMQAPSHAKKFGTQVPLRADWNEQTRILTMEGLLRQKFAIGSLGDQLRSIDGKIEEGNDWGDTFWGVDLKTGDGFNHLGKLLMKIRDER